MWTWLKGIYHTELDALLGDLSKLSGKLARYIDAKELQIADHIEEMTLHQNHIDVKSDDAARAARIRDKLIDLLK